MRKLVGQNFALLWPERGMSQEEVAEPSGFGQAGRKITGDKFDFRQPRSLTFLQGALPPMRV